MSRVSRAESRHFFVIYFLSILFHRFSEAARQQPHQFSASESLRGSEDRGRIQVRIDRYRIIVRTTTELRSSSRGETLANSFTERKLAWQATKEVYSYVRRSWPFSIQDATTRTCTETSAKTLIFLSTK